MENRLYLRLKSAICCIKNQIAEMLERLVPIDFFSGGLINSDYLPYIAPNVQSITSASIVTPLAENDLVVISSQAEGLTLANPTGIWAEGQSLLIRIKDNGTPIAITYDSAYRAIGVTLPTTTVATKTTYLGIVYNWVADKFDIIGVTTQA